MVHARHSSGTMPPEAGRPADRHLGQRSEVRGIIRWTAVVLAAVCTAAASGSSPASYGSVARQHTQHATRPAGPATPSPAVPRPTLSPSPTPDPTPSIGETATDDPDPVANQAPQPVGTSPFSVDGAVVVPEPSLNDADSAGVPEPGSRPRVGPFTPSGDAAAPGPDTHADLGAAGPPGGGTRTGWSILSGPVTGGRIFLAGFFGLLFSIGGLITIGIRRRRW